MTITFVVGATTHTLGDDVSRVMARAFGLPGGSAVLSVEPYAAGARKHLARGLQHTEPWVVIDRAHASKGAAILHVITMKKLENSKGTLTFTEGVNSAEFLNAVLESVTPEEVTGLGTVIRYSFVAGSPT